MADHKYIHRQLESTLLQLHKGFPCIVITGPRQSGKTTLARALFPEKSYISLEDLNEREFATKDPRGFLGRFPDGAILDEAQRCPDLFSYLQTAMDNDGRMGLFVLTGSQHFHLMESITQSLAGRAAMVQLPPFSIAELSSVGIAPQNPDSAMIMGGYPPIYTRPVLPQTWFENYTRTYIERDVRSLLNVKDLSVFHLFLKLCAGRVGQLVNLSALGAECGVSHNTVRAWLSVLETSAVVFMVRPYFRNFNKRLVQTPKVYFLDTGLLCSLLGIETLQHLYYHPQRGSIFENLIVSEVVKAGLNRGKACDLFFFRDRSGFEIDLVIEKGTRLDAVEIKSGKTVHSDFFKNLRKWKNIAGEAAGETSLVYGGEEAFTREGCQVMPWRTAAEDIAGNSRA